MDRHSHTRGCTQQLSEDDRCCRVAIDVLCGDHRRTSLLPLRNDVGSSVSFRKRIVAPLRCDERSSAPLQSRPVSARYYLDALSCQLARRTSTVSNRRAWITGYTAAAKTSTVTAATPVRSGSPSTPQSILMP